MWYPFCDEPFYHEDTFKRSSLNELKMSPCVAYASMQGLSGNCLIYSPSNHLMHWSSSPLPVTNIWGDQPVKHTWCPASVWILTPPSIPWLFITDSHSLNSFYKTWVLTFFIPSKSLFSQKISPHPTSLRKMRSVDKTPLSFQGHPYFPMTTLSTEGFMVPFRLTFVFCPGKMLDSPFLLHNMKTEKTCLLLDRRMAQWYVVGQRDGKKNSPIFSNVAVLNFLLFIVSNST